MFRWLNNLLKRAIHLWLFSYNYDIHLMEGGKVPIRAYKRDAGYDLYTSKSVTLSWKDRRKNISTGISIRSKIPAWIMMVGRSSTLMRYGIMIDSGIIDGDFIGELYIKAYNTTNETVHIPPDTRIAQIIVIPHTNIKFQPVECLVPKGGARNTYGFGSSGK